MKKVIGGILISIIGVFSLSGQNIDTVTIPQVEITSSLKTSENFFLQPQSIDNYHYWYLNSHNIADFKDFSVISPALYIPDYGSKVTSSIYLRALGSRIDNSSVGICLDEAMVMNKNCFDFSYFDLKSINIYKGASGVLFGMNTLAGVIDLTTVSAFDFQGIKASFGIENANTYKAKLSFYKKPSKHFAYMAGVDFMTTDGFFVNEYTGKKCDYLKGGNIRFKVEYINNNFSLINASYISLIHQGGYPYALFDTVNFRAEKVNYNDESSYNRFNLINNTVINYKKADIYRFKSVSSLQLNFDKLKLDNDFTDKDYFTLTQKENEIAFSQEFIIKDDNKKDNLSWLGGVFGYYRKLDINAPVLFKKDGIQTMVLNNANQGLHRVNPVLDIEFKDDNFTVEDDFKYPRYGFAIYGKASYNYNNWQVSLSARTDMEKIMLDYSSGADIDYKLSVGMTDYKHLNTLLKDKISKTFVQFSPQLSLSYITKKYNLFFSVAKGYMSGGYNTQMFADLVRNAMMQNMMADLGIKPKPGTTMSDMYTDYNTQDILNYEPQYIYDYETGIKTLLFDGKLSMNATLFYIDVRKQQLTVFLSPLTTGRMMTNAAKSRSFGGEFSVKAKIYNINLNFDYSYTNAKFTEFKDAKGNYKGNFLPYYPVHTVGINIDYIWNVSTGIIDNITFSGQMAGCGNIYYNTENTVKQKFYAIANCDITLRRNIYSLSLFARNIFNTQYTSFYFLSSGNNFVQLGKPVQMGVSFRINY